MKEFGDGGPVVAETDPPPPQALQNRKDDTFVPWHEDRGVTAIVQRGDRIVRT
jgi:hypothetical protein